jgi:hypothetical protein
MRSTELQRLNFERVLHYRDGAPVAAYRYPTPVTCTGFCVSCEAEGRLPSGKSFDLMSHGADTSDFEQVCQGPVPCNPQVKPFLEPVMFVLETPGGNWNFADGAPAHEEQICTHNEIIYKKLIPVNHYYWMPNLSEWPLTAPAGRGNRYGPYFAYLIWRFQLLKAYFTNIVKCHLRMGEVGCYNLGRYPQQARDNCMSRHFAEELKLFKPRVVFAFGRRVRYFLRCFVPRNNALLQVAPGLAHFCTLLHPAAHQAIVEENNTRIHHALQALD